MSAGEPPESPTEIVAAHIVQRYANPARKAHVYLFRLRPGAPLDVLPPQAESVLAAWVDEGQGLHLSLIDEAIQRCAAAMQLRATSSAPPPLALRKQWMARAAQFSLTQPDPEHVEVQLMSRALAYMPKGDRRALEIWQRAADGVWYSAKQPDTD